MGELDLNEYLNGTIIALQSVIDDDSLQANIDNAANVIINALKDGHKLLLFGNGGSAGDAQHIAAELVGRFRRERRGLPAIALTTDSSIMTSISNDYGFEYVFSRQVEALGIKGDVALGISTSGGSANVLRAIEAARENGLKTIGLCGKGGALVDAAEICICVPVDDTAHIQECHIAIGHYLCEVAESSMVK